MTREIPLCRKGIVITHALVDDDIYEWLSQWNWSLIGNNRYAGRVIKVNGKSKTIFMHRIILQPPDGMETDHIDGNSFNNCKSNLRVSTRNGNLCNRRKWGNTSRFKGVCRTKDPLKWQAYISFNGRRKYLGLFSSELEAARAYNHAALEHFGEFARINDIPE